MLYKPNKELNRRKNKTFATVKIMCIVTYRVFQRCIVKFTYPTYASLKIRFTQYGHFTLSVGIMNYLEIDVIRSLGVV